MVVGFKKNIGSNVGDVTLHNITEDDYLDSELYKGPEAAVGGGDLFTT